MYKITSILPRDDFDPSGFDICSFPTSDCSLCKIPRNLLVHLVVHDVMNGVKYCSAEAMPVRLEVVIQDELDHLNSNVGEDGLPLLPRGQS